MCTLLCFMFCVEFCLCMIHIQYAFVFIITPFLFGIFMHDTYPVHIYVSYYATFFRWLMMTTRVAYCAEGTAPSP